MPPDQSQVQKQVEAEERMEHRLSRATAEALGYLFASPDEHEEFDFEEFRGEVEAKGSFVTLARADGGTYTVPGEHFAEWVWGLIANA